MGKNNKARRAAKTKRKLQQQHLRKKQEQQQQHAYEYAQENDALDDMEMLYEAVGTMLLRAAQIPRKDEGAQEEVQQSARMIAKVRGADSEAKRFIAKILHDVLESAMEKTWKMGWLPAEILHCARNESKGVQVLLQHMILDDIAKYSSVNFSATWVSQLDSIRQTVTHKSLNSCIDNAQYQELVWEEIMDTLHYLYYLRPIPILERMPWEAPGSKKAARPGETHPIYDKVQALLRKAESSDSDAESEAFTAKAQQLISRYSLDSIETEYASGQDANFYTIRVLMEAPYESAKESLLCAIANANDCSVVILKGHSMCTVTGSDADLRAVELLFSSLLVQATSAMRRASSQGANVGGSRTRSFRQSFLVGFASRIGQRLHEQAEHAMEQRTQTTGRDLVPIVAQRTEARQEYVEELHGRLKQSRGPRITNAEGMVAGQAAADVARLTAAEAVNS